MSYAEDAALRSALAAPFDSVSYVPGGGNRPAVPYVDHAVVTARLNEEAPDWTLAFEIIEREGKVVAVKGAMFLGGKTIEEIGVPRPDRAGKEPATYGDAVKAAVSDLVKRAAMRFGVGLYLRAASGREGAGSEGRAPGKGREGAGPPPDLRNAVLERYGNPGAACTALLALTGADKSWRDFTPADLASLAEAS